MVDVKDFATMSRGVSFKYLMMLKWNVMLKNVL